MTFTLPAFTIGWVLALIILVLVVVFFAIGQLDGRQAALFGGLALARLL